MSLAEKFLKRKVGLDKLQRDIDVAKAKIALYGKEDEESKKMKDELSYESLLPMTILRKDEDEVKDAQKNPDLYYIFDVLRKVLRD